MKKWLYRVLLLICICVFGYSAFHLYTIEADRHENEKETETYQKIAESDKNTLDPDWNALKEKNPDIVGWIYVPGCDISFPIVQGNDNSYYLNHSTDKASSPYGAVFLDSHASGDFSDDNSIVYGHSVEGGGMFTNLKNFADESFFEKHKEFYLLTPDQNYVCHIFSYAKTTDESAYYTTDFGDYRDETLKKWIAQSLYHNDFDAYALNFISLSTCNLDYGFHSHQRYVLTGAIEETDDDIVL